MKYRDYFESNFYKKREELQKAMQSPQEVNIPVGGVATSTSPLNLQTPQATPQATPQITPQITPQTTSSPFPTLEEMTTTPTGLTAKEAVEKSVNFFDNIKNNLVELKDKIIRKYLEPIKLTLSDKELRKKNIYETASAGLTQLREHPLETIAEAAKPGVRAILKTYGLGLLDNLADSEIFDIKNQQLAGSEKTAEKAAEMISFLGLYGGMEKVYTGAAQKIIPKFLLKLSPTLNPETVSFLTSQMIKSDAVVRGLIDLGAWMTTDLMNANNFKLTEEEKQQGKNIFDKLLENSALSVATWGAFKAGEFVLMKGLINPIVKPSLDLFEKTFKKITNDIKDAIYFRRVNKIFDEASKVAKEIETPEIKTEIKPEVKVSEVKPEVKVPEVKPEVKPEIKPNLGKASVLEKEIKTIESDLSVADKVNFEKFFDEVKNKGIIAGNTLRKKLGGEVFTTDINKTINEIAEQFRYELGEKEKISSLIQEGGLAEEGASKLSGFHIIERAPAKEVKVDYAKQLEKALLQYNPQYSKKEINELVIKRYGKSLKEIAEAIKAGKTLAELNVVPEFSEAEINRLREVFDRFAQSKGTLNDFISAIYGKDISKLSKGDRLTAYKKAIEFSNLYQFKDYKEMYESLLKTNPELADTVGYEFKKGKPQKTKTTIRDTIDSAKEKIEDIKDKNILSYVRENIKANPDYTYADFIKDISAKEYGKILSEADIERMEDNGTWRTFITELDKKLKEKYKKTSAELFTSFIQEAIEASEKMPENEMLNTAIKISTTADIEKSATPIVDQVIREQSVEANAEIAKEMQKGALVLNLDKESVMTANEYIDRMFQQQEEAKKSIKEKTIEGLKDVNKMVRKLSGEFEVDDVLNKYFPKFINDEITFRAKVLKIQGDAFLAIRNIVQPLGKLEKELFNRIVALNDLWVTSMQGKETPLSGKATIQEIEETLKSLYQLARTRYPKVITAVRKHFELMRAVRTEMENFYGRTIDFSSGIDENIAKEMTDKLRVWSTIPNVELGDTYFHHKILDYVNYKYSNSSWIPKEIKKEFNQYTMKRGGSVRDISTDYENVVREYLVRTKHIFEIDKFYEDSVKKYNLLNLVNNLDTVNEKFFKPTEWRHGEVVPDDMIPESIKQKYPNVKWRAYGYERGRTVFPVKSVNEEMLAEAIEDGLTVEELMELRGPRGGLPIRDMLALGRRKATIILPEQIYSRLSKYRDANSKELAQLLSLVIKYTR